MFLSLDGTAWIQLLNFAIFFAILNVVFIRPVGAALLRRRQYIDSVHGDLDRYAHQVATLRAQAEAERLAARREAEEKVVAARAKAEDEAAKIAADYEAKAAAIAQQARETVAGEVRAARSRENELAAGLAQSLLDRAIGSAR
jgi:F0F1-type ATP synthase membrane subunit b/b'